MKQIGYRTLILDFLCGAENLRSLGTDQAIR